MNFVKSEFPTDFKCNYEDNWNDPNELVWKGPFTFIHAADTQFGLLGYNLLHLPEPNWETEKSLAEELVARVNEMDPKPRFLVMCGDMLDALPFTKEERPSLSFPPGDRTLRQKQYIDFVKVFRKLDSAVKLICVCGNHDIGDVPTRDSLQYYRREFGKDYFSFWVGGVKFVVLNSQFMYSPDAIPEETARQLEFLDTIPDARAKFIVVFQHIPYFVNDPHERSYHYNFNIPEDRRFKYLEILRKAGVTHIFCGHYHRNAGGYYGGIELMMTSAVGAPNGYDSSGYRLVRVGDQSISHCFKSIGNGKTRLDYTHK